MAAAIREGLGFDSELIGGSGGVFDILANGELVYSKHNEGNEFPEHQMVIDRLAKLIKA